MTKLTENCWCCGASCKQEDGCYRYGFFINVQSADENPYMIDEEVNPYREIIKDILGATLAVVCQKCADEINKHPSTVYYDVLKIYYQQQRVKQKIASLGN